MAVPTVNVPLDNIRQSGQAPDDLRDHYESATLDALRVLWRRRFLVCTMVLIAVAIAMALLAVLPRRYTAEALIQLDFLRQSPGMTAPTAAVEASVLAESDVRYIASRPMTRKVAKRFASADTEQTVEPEGLPRLLGELRRVFLPETSVTDPLEKAAIAIGKRLQVMNVTRTYLIAIRFTADTPQKAADVANAFAQEFFTDRHLQELVKREADAHQEVLKLSSVYGAQHPLLLAAQERFALAQKQLVQERDRHRAGPSYPPPGFAIIAAQPVATPSSPKGTLFLALALLLGGGLGMAAAWIAERRDGGFRTGDEVFRVTGVRCAGVIPHAPSERIHEAMRALCLEAGILGYDKTPKVVLISTPLADAAIAQFGARLASVIVEAGHRVLSIDAGPSGGAPQDGAATPIEHVLNDEQSLEGLLRKRAQERHTALCRGSDPDSAFHVPLRALERVAVSAHKAYDAVLIEAAPVLTSSDALRLAPMADIHLHVVVWRKTRRRPTALAVQRFRRIGARVSGIVLIEANLRGYRKYPAADQFYYSGTNRTRKAKEDVGVVSQEHGEKADPAAPAEARVAAQ
jgi:Mrp family chromosome partitioning ATPase